MDTIKKLEKGCGNIHNYNNDGSTEGCVENSLCGSCELEIQTLKNILELIDELIDISEEDYKDVSPTPYRALPKTYLKILKQKITGDEE